MERRAGRHPGLVNDGRRVCRSAQRFGAKEGDLSDPEATCGLHVPDERGDELAAAG